VTSGREGGGQRLQLRQQLRGDHDPGRRPAAEPVAGAGVTSRTVTVESVQLGRSMTCEAAPRVR
jgi:hypothetical protein